jgi:hypothetical protein
MLDTLVNGNELWLITSEHELKHEDERGREARRTEGEIGRRQASQVPEREAGSGGKPKAPMGELGQIHSS